MNILILGTSNSILKNGYVDGLRSSLPTATITNSSVGASPGVQFGLTLQNPLSKYTYIIFDSTPNDEQYLYETDGYEEDNCQEIMLNEIISSLSNQSNLIVISFCLSKYLDESSKLHKNRFAMAKTSNAHFIDVADILLSYRVARPEFPLYEDHPAHPSLALSYEIGRLIGQKIGSGSFQNRSGRSQNYSNHFRSFRPAQEFPGLTTKLFKNSLMEEAFTVLQSSSELRLPRGRCVGFYVNSRGTTAGVRFMCGGHTVLTTNLNYDRSDGFQKLFVPIPGSPEIDSVVTGSFFDKPDFIPRMMSVHRVEILEEEAVVQASEFLLWRSQDILVSLDKTKEALSDYHCRKVSREIALDLFYKTRFELECSGRITGAVPAEREEISNPEGDIQHGHATQTRLCPECLGTLDASGHPCERCQDDNGVPVGYIVVEGATAL